MVTVNEYFQHIFIINRRARTDRWEFCEEQIRRFNLKAERFEAYDHALIDGHVGGHGGCTSSHRAILDVIAYHQWPRTLILEDDFKILHDDFHERFDSMIKEVPDTWDFLFLGGHYADAPQRRISKHVIKFNRMMTTSSYGITWQMARLMAPNIYGSAPIDTLYFGFQPDHNCYIFQPRLIVQRESYSDLQGCKSNNEPCMVDERHENLV